MGRREVGRHGLRPMEVEWTLTRDFAAIKRHDVFDREVSRCEMSCVEATRSIRRGLAQDISGHFLSCRVFPLRIRISPRSPRRVN
jgi:hypothetical protein